MSRRAPLAVAAASCALVLAATVACGRAAERPDDAAEADSPLGGYLNEIFGGTDPDTADADAIRSEELLAECMAEQGFEYYPVVSVAGTSPLEHELGWGSLEFAEQFGYGYTTEPWGPGGGNLWSRTAEANDADARNDAYVASLSIEAKHEYEAALAGVLVHPPNEGEEIDWHEAGCLGRQALVAEAAETQFAEVQDALGQALTGIEQDPRVSDAVVSWASCMAGAGYPSLSAVADAENLVAQTVFNFMTQAAARVEPGPGETLLDAIKTSAPDELAALQAEEIAVAVADATCRERVDYERIHQAVKVEYEQEFVDAHRADLEAWVDAVHAAEEATG